MSCPFSEQETPAESPKIQYRAGGNGDMLWKSNHPPRTTYGKEWPRQEIPLKVNEPFGRSLEYGGLNDGSTQQRDARARVAETYGSRRRSLSMGQLASKITGNRDVSPYDDVRRGLSRRSTGGTVPVDGSRSVLGFDNSTWKKVGVASTQQERLHQWGFSIASPSEAPLQASPQRAKENISGRALKLDAGRSPSPNGAIGAATVRPPLSTWMAR
jgi:hypothetical protein